MRTKSEQIFRLVTPTITVYFPAEEDEQLFSAILKEARREGLSRSAATLRILRAWKEENENPR